MKLFAFKNTFACKCFIAFTLLVFSLSNVSAGHEKGSSRMELTNYNSSTNNHIYLEDNKFTTVTANLSTPANFGFFDHTYKNRLVLGIDRTVTDLGSISSSLLSTKVYRAEVDVKLQYNKLVPMGPTYSLSGVTVVKTLTVSFSGFNAHTGSNPTTEIDLDAIAFENGYQAIAKVTGVRIYDSYASTTSLTTSDIPENLYLELQSDAERYHTLTTSSNPLSNTTDIDMQYITGSSTGNQVEVKWKRISGAEEYDLEWLWLDEYTYNTTIGPNMYWLSNPELNFKANSTRIRTDQNFYNITNVYESGYIFVRIRAVGITKTPAALIALGNPILTECYTPWTWGDLSSSVTLSVPATFTLGTNVPKYLNISSVNSHEENKNWVYTSTFAEEGKKKEVVNYFDGAQYSRQVVTTNNSENIAVVGETYYDFVGRAAIQALPTPVDDATLKFYQTTSGTVTAFNFDNTSSQKKAFTKDIFAKAASANVCSMEGIGMSVTYGTAKYYSANNPFINNNFYNGYTPSSQRDSTPTSDLGFPYAQTIYTKDNTGKVARQGGVGDAFKINTVGANAHDTRYLYGSVTQEELDRLFGSEAGYAKNYTKNVVIDPNGQISISYLNQDGKVVATALGDASPSNLEALKTATGYVLASASANILTVDLLNKNSSTATDAPTDNNQLEGDKLIFNSKFAVTTAGTYSFDYSLLGSTFQACGSEPLDYLGIPTNTAGSNPQDLCYDCVYDLVFEVRDACGNNPPGFSALTFTLGKIVGPFPSNNNPTPNLDGTCGNDQANFNFQQLVGLGNTVDITLDIGEYTIIKILKVNKEALNWYLNDYITKCPKPKSAFEDDEEDNSDGSGCEGGCKGCVADLGGKSTYTTTWQAENGIDPVAAEKAYNDAVAACLEPCKYQSYCDVAKEGMIMDMSPKGQYAEYSDESATIDANAYPLSIFNPTNVLVRQPSSGLMWQNPEYYKSTPPSGSNINHYFDEDGAVAKVQVKKINSTTYVPALVTSAPVTYIANSIDQYLVEPQYLANVSDFVNTYKDAWGRSLLKYHPEFCYLKWCIQEEEMKLTTSTNTTTAYIKMNTYNSAFTATTGSEDVLFRTSYGYDSLMNSIEDIDDVFNSTTQGANVMLNPLEFDPYWKLYAVHHAADHTALPSAVTQPKPSVYASGNTNLETGTPALGNSVAQLQSTSSQNPQDYSNAFSFPYFHYWERNLKTANNRFYNYKGSGLNLLQYAAVISTSLANSITQSGSQLLTSLHANYYQSYTITGPNDVNYILKLVDPGNPSDPDKKYMRIAWENFKSLYMSLKNEMQQEAAQSYVMNGDCRGCNNCIGDPEFEVNEVKFTPYANKAWLQLISNPTSFSFPSSTANWATYNNDMIYLQMMDWYQQSFSSTYTKNKNQFCGLETGDLYKSKIKRFSSNDEITSGPAASPQNAQAAIYEQTGLCPNAYELMGFLNAMAQNTTNLINTNLDLSVNIPEFSQTLYHTILPITPVPFVHAFYQWQPTSTTTQLDAFLHIGTTDCNLSLNMPVSPTLPTGINSWASYTATSTNFTLTQLDNLVPTGLNTFNIRATVKHDVSSVISTYTLLLSGTVSSMLNLTDCDFVPPCKINGNGKAISALLNTFSSNGAFPSPYNGSAYVSGDLLNTATATNTPYSYVFTNTFKPLLENVAQSNTWKWQFFPSASPPYIAIFDGSSSSPSPNTKTLTIEFNTSSFVFLPDQSSSSTTMPDIACIQSIQNFQPDPAVAGGFLADGVISNMVNFNSCGSGIIKMKGVVKIGTSAGSQTLALGTCSFNLATCNTPAHEIKKDFENWALSSSAGFVSMVQSTSQDISSNIYLTQLMRSYLPSQQTTSSGPVQNYYWWLQDAATATNTAVLKGWFIVSQSSVAPTVPPANACKVEIKKKDITTLADMNDLSDLGTSFTLVKSPLNNGNAYSFKAEANFTSNGPDSVLITTSCLPMRSCETQTCVTTFTNNASSFVDSIYVYTDHDNFALFDQDGNNYAINLSNTTTAITNTNLDATIYTGTSGSKLIQYNEAKILTGCPSTPAWTFPLHGGVNSGPGRLVFANIAECPSSNCTTYNKNRTTTFVKQFNLTAGGYFSFTLNDMGATNLNSNCLESNVVSSDYTEYFIDDQLFYSHQTTTPGNTLLGKPIPFGLTSGNHTLRIVFHFSNLFSMRSIANAYLTKTGDMISSLPCPATDTWPTDTMPTANYVDPCAPYLEEVEDNTVDEKYNAFIDSVKSVFIKKYTAHCIGNAIENMSMTYGNKDYHYTLYYYDQAGNLARTVPPQGVKPIDLTAIYSGTVTKSAAIKADRAGYPSTTKQVYTDHRMITTYKYNSLNQLVQQETPDAGISKFYYDNLGRLVASQNAEQKDQSTPSANQKYSYTKYDELGRISMVGTIGTYDLDSYPSIPSGQTIKDVISHTNYPFNLAIYTTTAYNSHREVTQTYYGDAVGFTPVTNASNFSNGFQDNLRSRVASVSIEEVYDGNILTYDHSTHYSYDIHGNVKELIQDNPKMGRFTGQRLKKMQYTYDLISGKVNSVVYQRGKRDMYVHSYLYDANNRITNVYTSRDSVLWDQDAKYYYYLHGPLARVEIGNYQVQGMDYAYTLQGWIKGVNSEGLKETNDMGKDGYSTLTASSNSYDMNRFMARDGFGYALSYYNITSPNTINDYYPVNGANTTGSTYFLASDVSSVNNLYNGNIKQMSASYLNPDPSGSSVPDMPSSTTISEYEPYCFKRGFKYDQLNRIINSEVKGRNIDGSNAWINATGSTAKFAENFAYDQNGNIITLDRKSNTGNMDNLTYYYYDRTGTGVWTPASSQNTWASYDPSNKLAYVDDGQGAATIGDIADQSSGNYTYDKIGNMISDAISGITSINWTLYGKIKAINKATLAGYSTDYKYDASGNRVYKRVYDAWTGGSSEAETYYVRDAQGNVMATYNVGITYGIFPSATYETLNLQEHDLYGSSRLGIRTYNDVLGYIVNNVNTSNANIVTALDNGRKLGYKAYETSNHLGNVIATVSDRKLPVDVATADGIIDYFVPDVLTASDYYAFGSQMPGRLYNGGNYRYGFNGKENDNELKGNGNQQDYGMRIYDGRLGKFLSVDPLIKDYPWYSPYHFAGNTPIQAIDLDGTEEKIVIYYTGQDGSQFHRTILWSDLFPGMKYGPKGAGIDYYYYDEKTKKAWFSIHVTSIKEEVKRLDYLMHYGNRVPIKVENEPGAPSSNTDTWTGELDGNAQSVISKEGGGSGGYDKGEDEDSPKFNVNGKVDKKSYDKDGFFKLPDGTWQKNYDLGKIFKSKDGKDTTVTWETGGGKNYNDLTKEDLEEIKTWKPE